MHLSVYAVRLDPTSGAKPEEARHSSLLAGLGPREGSETRSDTTGLIEKVEFF